MAGDVAVVGAIAGEPAVQPVSDSTAHVLADIRRHFADIAVDTAAVVGETSRSAEGTADKVPSAVHFAVANDAVACLEHLDASPVADGLAFAALASSAARSVDLGP